MSKSIATPSSTAQAIAAQWAQLDRDDDRQGKIALLGRLCREYDHAGLDAVTDAIIAAHFLREKQRTSWSAEQPLPTWVPESEVSM
jgi:hypothetical protein